MDPKKHLIMIDKNGRFEDKTEDIIRFEINRCQYTIYFKGRDEPYNYGRHRVNIISMSRSIDVTRHMVFGNNQYLDNISELLLFPPYYKVFFKDGRTKVFPQESVSLVENSRNDKEVENVIEYLKEVSSLDSGMTEDSTAFLSSQFENMESIPKPSILFRIIKNIQSEKSPYPKAVIFPFSSNASQKVAVTKALNSEISFVQGPPGTGKTQTILNMIANYVRAGKNGRGGFGQ